jgi:predicted GNAT family acetyltransferase
MSQPEEKGTGMHHLAQPSLDRPIWTALTTVQAHFCQGDQLARRYHPDVAPFAAVASESPAAYEALHRLLLPREQVALLSFDPVAPIDALRAERIGSIDQMVATRNEAAGEDNRDVIALSRADVQDMLDLVQRTRPGPFAKRTYEMGNYIGIRDRGRLVAMAGERMHLEGYVEISAVCVDDDWRGKGIAARLVNLLRTEIVRRGAIPLLHVLSDNQTAIRLYERLGFELRRTFFLTRVGHADPGAA